MAIEHGYKIEVHESYLFEKGYDYFKDYVKDMAFIKDNSEGAMRDIHKLLLNTLYGRLGMKDSPDCIKIVSPDEARKIHLTNKVIENFTLNEDKEYIRYRKNPDEVLCNQSDISIDELMIKNEENISINSSSAIAAAIASWSRIIMYPYLKDALYTDTDSVIYPQDLSTKIEVGKGLGKFKTEGGLITHAIFPSSKLYFLEKEDGTIVSKSKGITIDLSKNDYLKLYNECIVEVIDER